MNPTGWQEYVVSPGDYVRYCQERAGLARSHFRRRGRDGEAPAL